MRYYADQGNLHTRIYAMRGRLLTLRDYASLIREKEAFFGKAAGVRDTAGSKETVFREQMEEVMLLAEATSDYAPLFTAFLRQYEANNAKLVLARSWGRVVLEQWYDIGHFAVLERDLLERRLSMSDLRAHLAGTYLEGAFEGVLNYDRLMIRVDMCAFRDLYASSIPFPRDDREVFLDFLHTRFAVMSLIWGLRLKEGYHFSDERIRLFIDEFHDLVGGHARPKVRMVEEALQRRLELMRKTGPVTPGVSDIENLLEQYFYQWVSSRFHRDFLSVHCVPAYLWMLNCQVKNLFRIIDGARFGLSHDDILARIVCEA